MLKGEEKIYIQLDCAIWIHILFQISKYNRTAFMKNKS